VNGQEKGSAAFGVPTERVTDLAGLAEIQPVEWLVRKEQRLRRKQTNRQHGTFALALGQRPDTRREQRLELQGLDHLVAKPGGASEVPDREVEAPPDSLGGPRRDAVRKIEERFGALARAEGPAGATDFAAISRHLSRQALEQGGLAGAVRADQAEHFAGVDGERHVG
jgi:hypothetical protein